MPKIISIHAREILDSRGNPTVEVELNVLGGKGVASVPSGASTGVHEALELRDGDKKRYGGKGVLKAVRNVNETIASAVVGKSVNQRQLDEFLIELDGTKNKTRLGANAILGVSLAFARAAASAARDVALHEYVEEAIKDLSSKEQEVLEMRFGSVSDLAEGKELYQYLGELAGNTKFTLPTPMTNIINGGKHADSGLDIQEFMIVPVKFQNFHERLRAGSEIFHTLKEILEKKGYQTGVGDEGGFAPRLGSNEKALDLIVEAIKKAGYTGRVKIAMDVAASSFYEKGIYKLKINGREKKAKSKELMAWYKKLLAKYPIVSIEDPFAEDDWAAFTEMTKIFGKKIKIVGDDLLVTNIERIKMAIDRDAVNSVLIKLNQIGTLSETIDAIQMTQKQGWSAIVSHRSGETEDSFIADLVVGLGCPFIKTGSLSRSERICKYNRLMWIEDRLGK